MILCNCLFVVQMCELLHYFCDCELKQRIESIVAFSDDFVSKLQYNQKFRYNELMQALNMSAAVTAKKTKEFRSPPQEQVSLLQRPHRVFESSFFIGCPEKTLNGLLFNLSSAHAARNVIHFTFLSYNSKYLQWQRNVPTGVTMLLLNANYVLVNGNEKINTLASEQIVGFYLKM